MLLAMLCRPPTMAGESCREEEGLVSTPEGDWRGRKQTLDSHRLLSELVVKSLQTLVGVVKFPPGLLLKRIKKSTFLFGFAEIR